MWTLRVVQSERGDVPQNTPYTPLRAAKVLFEADVTGIRCVAAQPLQRIRSSSSARRFAEQVGEGEVGKESANARRAQIDDSQAGAGGPRHERLAAGAMRGGSVRPPRCGRTRPSPRRKVAGQARDGRTDGSGRRWPAGHLDGEEGSATTTCANDSIPAHQRPRQKPGADPRGPPVRSPSFAATDWSPR